MMASGAVASYSTLLKVGDGATSEAFTTIAEVVEINGVKLARETKDVTSFDSSGWREFIPTLKEASEITFKVNFLPANATQSYAAGLIKDWDDGTLRNFQLIFPDAGTTTWLIPAYVTAFEAGDLTVEGGMEGEFTLQPSGAPTLE